MTDRLERLTNLVALLLDTRAPLTLEQIVDQVDGYPRGNRESTRRQFERDKELLRSAGLPLVTVPVDHLGGEPGYRIPPEEYELPPLDLTPAERAALHVAVTAVRLDEGAGRAALHKLGGLDGEAAPALAFLPRLPALQPLFTAARAHATVTFEHRGARRTLDPYAVLFRRGHWYVVGHDHDRAAPRAFRLDRIDDGSVAVGGAGAFEPPPGLDPVSLLHDDPWAFGEGEPTEVTVLVDAPQADDAVAVVGPDAVVERRPDGSVVLAVEVTNRSAFRAFVLGFLDGAEVLAPPEVRAEMVEWLRALAGPAAAP